MNQGIHHATRTFLRVVGVLWNSTAIYAPNLFWLMRAMLRTLLACLASYARPAGSPMILSIQAFRRVRRVLRVNLVRLVLGHDQTRFQSTAANEQVCGQQAFCFCACLALRLLLRVQGFPTIVAPLLAPGPTQLKTCQYWSLTLLIGLLATQQAVVASTPSSLFLPVLFSP